LSQIVFQTWQQIWTILGVAIKQLKRPTRQELRMPLSSCKQPMQHCTLMLHMVVGLVGTTTLENSCNFSPTWVSAWVECEDSRKTLPTTKTLEPCALGILTLVLAMATASKVDRAMEMNAVKMLATLSASGTHA
jgi:hypothetical protein